MKTIIYLPILFVLVLVGCAPAPEAPVSTAPSEPEQKIRIKAHPHMKNGDVAPASFLLEPAMEPGEILLIKHKDHTIAHVTLEGDIKLKQISLRFRAMGTGYIFAMLQKKDGQKIGWKKHIEIDAYNPIPKKSTVAFNKRERVQDQALKMIILNSSAETGYVKKVIADFGVGKVIVHGYKYFSENPYFAIYPDHYSGTPSAEVILAK